VISTNRCERNLGYVKSRVRPMRGLKSFACAIQLFPALDALQLVERDFVRVPLVSAPCTGGRSYVRARHIAGHHSAGPKLVGPPNEKQPDQTTGLAAPTHANVGESIKAHGSAPARELAAWLGAHLHGAQLVERERYLVVPAEDLETLSERCASLEASLRRIGLPMERIQASDELAGVFNGCLTPRPQQSRMGPAVVDTSASCSMLVDGEYVRAFDLGKLPPSIVTDWASPLVDGDLPVDVSIDDVEPLDLGWPSGAGHAQECPGIERTHARAHCGTRADRRVAHGVRAA
jgi:hypothetical protein